MLNKWLLVVLFALPLSVLALTFGDIQVRSKLNQPFEAVVPVLSGSPAQLRELTVALASDTDYRRYGQEKASFLNALSFSVSDSAIVIRSREVFREPIVYLVLDMDWRTGRLVKSYPVLLDPPVASLPATFALPVLETATMRRSEAGVAGSVAAVDTVVRVPVAPPALAAPKPVRVASTNTRAPAKRPSEYVVRSGDTLFGLAQRFPIRGTTFYQVAMTIYQQNPNAFVNGNPDRIIARSRIRVPSAVVFASSAEAQAAYNQAKATGSIPGAASTPVLAMPVTAAPDEQVTLALRDPPAANNLDLERQLTTARTELTTLQAQFAQTRSEFNNLQNERSRLQAQNQTLTVQVQTLEADLTNSRTRVSSLEAAATAGDNQLRSSLAAAEREIADLKMKLREAQMRAATLPTQEPPSLPPVAPVAILPTQELPLAAKNLPTTITTLPLQNPSLETTEPSRETPNPLLSPTPVVQGQGDNAIMMILAGGIVLAVLLLLILIRFIFPVKPKPRVALAGGGSMDLEVTPQRLNPASSWKGAKKAEMPVAEEKSAAATTGVVAAGGAVAGTALATHKPTEEEEVDFDSLNMDVADLAALNEDNVSPISEANTLIQFGMYAQATDLLKEELQHDPSSVALRLKLAEVYHAEGEVAAFTEQAQLLQDMPLNVDQITGLTTMADSLGVSLDQADDNLGDLTTDRTPLADVDAQEASDVNVRPGDFDKDSDLLADELGLSNTDTDMRDMLGDFIVDDADKAAMPKPDVAAKTSPQADDSDLDALNLDDFTLEDEKSALPATNMNMATDFDKFSSDSKMNESDLDALNLDDFALEEEKPVAPSTMADSDDFHLDTFRADDLSKTDDDLDLFEDSDSDLALSKKDSDFDDDFFAADKPGSDATSSRPTFNRDMDNDPFAQGDDFARDNMLGGGEDFNLDAADKFSADDDFNLDGDTKFASDKDFNLDNTLAGATLDNNFDEFNQAFRSGAAMDPEEVNTQLDLASMFIDMGDKEGAQEILHNVLGSAAGEQKRRAEDLLRKIS